MKSLKDQVRDLELNKAQDFDPEDSAFSCSNEDESQNEEELKDDAGREHYETVGKSNLRKPEQPVLGVKYEGVAVSRKVLVDDEDYAPFAPVEEDEDEDPFAAKNEDASASEDGLDVFGGLDHGSEVEEDEDEEIDSDEAMGESDAPRFENFQFRDSKDNRIESPSEDETSAEDLSDQSDGGSIDDSDIGVDDEDEDQDDNSSVSSTTSPPPRTTNPPRSSDREELKKVAFSSTSTAELASTLSAGANADVKKGQAVKQQRQSFDRLLDARIKLQKGVSAMNELPSTTILTDEEIKKAAQQAEDAALTLWSTIDSIRCAMLFAQDKSESKLSSRKRPFEATRSTPLSETWQQTLLLDSAARPLCRGTLDKWHTKTQPVLDTSTRSKLLKPSQTSHSRITDVLDTYLATESAKLTALSTPTPDIYDDGPFYQTLLRDLIASRNVDNPISASALGGGQGTYLPTKLHPSGSRGKKVDTKASKGRKVRYTVHEKLENFMAPEDRTTWTDAARSEFFASLLGSSAPLNEDSGGESEGGRSGDEDMMDGESQALRLFRN
ncbi:uncharacterized protein Z518_07227 [Rhinocladiella mackenziei CBS 650.93]|uniref:Protein BFR2 n=1 Tax=Rhinocladiella mackenziei CBS 650.93 TaxID=1442369 RepID=A0A0D2ICT9_9EURO|nr:uncharacterized protein Z518_07227 [Rhinocladiella mackenziei CBS 650.93]KIX03674.1 hypothetical protein Z518_07227 [Rhinocladiella mackenziei CBS 650.93]